VVKPSLISSESAGETRACLIEPARSSRASRVEFVALRANDEAENVACYGNRMEGATWKKVHAELTRLAGAKGAYDAEEARWLVEAKRVRVHEALGFATLHEYLERLFGYGPRLATERLRVAEALTQLLALRDALAAGELSWSAVREISRVAVAATEAEWIAAAAGKTVRQVEEMVSGRKAGDRPDDPADAGATRHVLRLEISADAMAAFRDARRQIELQVGHSLDDDALVRQLAQHALGGPGDPGRAAYQIEMTVCAECGRGTRDGAGQTFAVTEAEVEAARCDAQTIDLSHVGETAKQEIPPRTRRLVWRRDHGRCRVPGCRSAKYLEVHHIVPRECGGGHDPSNLIVLCGAHHGLIHRGVIRLEGTAPDRLIVRHRDGRPYGQLGSALARAAGVGIEGRKVGGRERDGVEQSFEADVLDGLRRMGVPNGDARRAVAEAARSGGGSLEDLLRASLGVLRRTTYASRISEASCDYSPTWAAAWMHGSGRAGAARLAATVGAGTPPWTSGGVA
jgi:5-methylcytosine-specific restriction endonuclease McrA